MADSTLYLNLKDKDGDPVQGESIVKGFEQQIQLTSIKWGAKSELPRDQRASQMQQRSGRQCKFGSVTVTRDYDLASSRIYGDMKNSTVEPYASATITAITFETAGDEIDLTARETGGTVVLEIELKGVRVHQVTLQAAQKDKGADVTETVELQFTGITLKYYPPVPGGKRAKSPKTFAPEDHPSDSGAT